MSDLSVKVAVRIRPLVPIETEQACGRCVEKVKGEPQVVLGGGEKAFTFDQVYDSDSAQADVYKETVQPLLDSFFQGFNVTVFAYGQTGSGKTHTMGTNDGKVEGLEQIADSTGIIPRIVAETFERIEQERSSGTAVSHTVRVSFLEIHNDDIHDLLDTTPKTCTLREDTSGAVLVSGLEEFTVCSSRELLGCLGRGSQNRATASTCMNAVSSRSHAVFTITMEKTSSIASMSSSEDTPSGPEGGEGSRPLDGSTVIARFHLVDLAGSERAKRTKAEGQRLKEGININKGLLALGNVISALTGESGSGGHVPYRDSKLTRMLQDSLGGNSRTIMIACVSPADSNFEETLNTLKYANRAKNIKNKAVVNVSSSNAEIAQLRAHVLALEAQLSGARKGSGGHAGVAPVESERVKSLEDEIRRLKAELHTLSIEASRKTQKALALEIKVDRLLLKLQEHGLHAADVESAGPNDSRVSIGEGRIFQDDTDTDAAHVAFGIDVGDAGGVSAGKVLIQHTMQQAALTDELQGIEESLGLKEKLLEQLQEGERKMQSLKSGDEQELCRMREQLEALQRERDDLIKVANNKAKLPELEEQLALMKRRVQESERALRLKQDSDRRIVELRNDIDSMKKNKISLLRKMRDDADRFREWRGEQQREVTSLKRQQKQSEYEKHKMQQQLDQQQLVLKRKMDEANAANMRLRTLLQKKENVKASKMATAAAGGGGGGGGGDEGGVVGLEQWLETELSFCVEVRRVRNLLSQQMEQRADINKEMTAVKEQLAAAHLREAAEPRHQGTAASGGGALKEKLAALQNQWKVRQGIKTLTAAEEREALEQRLLTLEENVSTCSGAIGQLQRELLEVEGNNDRERNVALNCPHLRSIQDAKKAVKCLFSSAIKAELRASEAAGEGADGEERASVLALQVERLERELKEAERRYQAQVLQHEQQAQEKTLYLLSAMTDKAITEASHSHSAQNSASQNSAPAHASAASGGSHGGGGATGGGGGGGGSGFSSCIMERLRMQQKEIDRLAAVAEERNELMRLQEEARMALEEKDNELQEVKRLSGQGRQKGPPKKKPSPKVEIISDSESEEEEVEEEESASDDEWMPSAPKRGAAAAARRRGRRSNESGGGEREEGEQVEVTQAPKGRGAGGSKSKTTENKTAGKEERETAGKEEREREVGVEEAEWEDAEEIIPSMPDLQAMKVPALKDLCGRHGLKKTGKKDELVERLCAKGLLQGGEGGGKGGHGREGGGDAAVMSLIQDSDLYPAKYKVRLGRAGAVMLGAAQDDSDEERATEPDRRRKQMLRIGDDDEAEVYKLGDVVHILSQQSPDASTAAPRQRCEEVREEAVGRDEELNVEAFEFVDASRLQKRQSAEAQSEEAEAVGKVEEVREGDGEWKNAAAFEMELDGDDAPEMTARSEQSFAAAMEKMKSYIDKKAPRELALGESAGKDTGSLKEHKSTAITANAERTAALKHTKPSVASCSSSSSSSSASCAAADASGAAAPALKKEQRVLTAAAAAAAISAASAASLGTREERRDVKEREDKENKPSSSSSKSAALPVGSSRSAWLGAGGAGVAAAPVGSLAPAAGKVKIFGDGKFGSTSGGGADAGKAKEGSGVGVGGGTAGNATTNGGPGAVGKAKLLQPVSAASANSRLFQPLKSLTAAKKPGIVAVIGKSKEETPAPVPAPTREKTAQSFRAPSSTAEKREAVDKPAQQMRQWN